MRIHTVSKFIEGTTKSHYFFHDKHDVPAGLSEKWVPTTVYLPMQVVPRPGLEDGMVDTVAKYIQIFHYDDIEVTLDQARLLES